MTRPAVPRPTTSHLPASCRRGYGRAANRTTCSASSRGTPCFVAWSRFQSFHRNSGGIGDILLTNLRPVHSERVTSLPARRRLRRLPHLPQQKRPLVRF